MGRIIPNIYYGKMFQTTKQLLYLYQRFTIEIAIFTGEYDQSSTSSCRYPETFSLPRGAAPAIGPCWDQTAPQILIQIGQVDPVDVNRSKGNPLHTNPICFPLFFLRESHEFKLVYMSYTLFLLTTFYHYILMTLKKEKQLPEFEAGPVKRMIWSW